jgi:hypothetical protein
MLIEQRHRQYVLPARDDVPALRAEQRMQSVGDGILGGHGQDVGGRTLQHRHVLRGLGQGRDQGYRGRAGADHDDALARIVQVRRPVLRVYDLAAKVTDACERRQVPLVVAVVATAHEQEAAGHRHRLGAV